MCDVLGKREPTSGQRINTVVNYPVTLDVAPFIETIDQDAGPKRFDLVAVSNHHKGGEGGHYKAACKTSGGRWKYFDDGRKAENCFERPIRQDSRRRSSVVYLLFYVRRDAAAGGGAPNVNGDSNAATRPAAKPTGGPRGAGAGAGSSSDAARR